MTDLRWKFLLTGREKSKISPHTLLGNLVAGNGHNYDGNDGDDDSNGYDKDEEYDDNAGTMVVMMMMFPPGMGCGLVGLLLTMVTSALVLRFI